MNKLLFSIALLINFLIFPKDTFASSLSLSPSNGTFVQGDIVSLKLMLDTTGESVNAFSAYISYPADKLEIVSTDYTKVFNITAENYIKEGEVRISRGNINPVKGLATIGTIKFKAKEPGTVDILFIEGTAVPRASDSTDTYTTGKKATYQITASVAGVSKVVDIVGPKISNLQVKDISTNSVTITWTTDKKAFSSVKYGTEKDSYFSDVIFDKLASNFRLDHVVKISGEMLAPGAKLHFRAVSEDSLGNKTESEDRELQLTGFNVILKVVDNKGEPLKFVEVTIFSDPITALTDQHGEVRFDNLTEGTHKVVVKKNLTENTFDVSVNGSNNAPVTLQINDSKTKINSSILKIIYIVVAVLLLIAVIILIIKFLKRKKPINLKEKIKFRLLQKDKQL